MVRAAAVALALALASPTWAQEQATVRAKDPVDLVQLSEAAFVNCLTTYQNGIERRQLGFAGTNCTFAMRQQIEPAFADVRGRRETPKAALPGLADYYVLWQASMDGLEPAPGETRITYSARQAAALQGLRLAGAKLRYAAP